jgi:hypothetical protein
MLAKALDEMYRFPLTSFATDALNHQLRGGIGDAKLAEFVLLLREEDRLCLVVEDGDATPTAPRIICSMGLVDSVEAR